MKHPSKKKILTVLGARPQFIKAAVLSSIIRERDEMNEVIVHTGQHFDQNMSEVFFEELDIPAPAYNLNVNGLGHGAMTGQMMEKIEEVCLEEKPDLVLVYGDTNSTLAGALVAKKLHIRLAHVEAGLRSFNMKMPEEVNRILTDRISDLLFCPTPTAMDNLRREGFDQFGSKFLLTGDIMKDSVSFFGERSEQVSSAIEDLKLSSGNFVLATVHRQENTSDRDKLRGIVKGLNKIAEDCEVVLPLHPGTRKKLEEGGIDFEGRTIDPLGYLDMLQLLRYCSLVITDSGGLQKEAYFNEKQTIILREETEWTELVEKGYARIVGSDPRHILAAFQDLISRPKVFESDLYGSDPGERTYEEIRRAI